MRMSTLTTPRNLNSLNKGSRVWLRRPTLLGLHMCSREDPHPGTMDLLQAGRLDRLPDLTRSLPILRVAQVRMPLPISSLVQEVRRILRPGLLSLAALQHHRHRWAMVGHLLVHTQRLRLLTLPALHRRL